MAVDGGGVRLAVLVPVCDNRARSSGRNCHGRARSPISRDKWARSPDGAANGHNSGDIACDVTATVLNTPPGIVTGGVFLA